jgi:hypothetical protein
MYKPVFCISHDIDQTTRIVNNLKMAGFSNNEISVLFSETSTSPKPACNSQDNVDETVNVAPEGGADLEWIAGIDSVDIPDVGRFIAAGPVMLELSRIPPKKTLGNLIDALIGVGIPGHEAEHYQEKIKGGCTLIAVNTASAETRDTANNIFQQAQAEDISSSEEASAIV